MIAERLLQRFAARSVTSDTESRRVGIAVDVDSASASAHSTGAMAVIIAESFFPSLASLDKNEKARVIDFMGEFLANPASPGLSLERVTDARSDDVWSARVSRDLRAIAFKDGETWALLFAGHHDPAYRWAERRNIGRHSVTGALQIVETVESVAEAEPALRAVAATAETTPVVRGLLAEHDGPYLLSLGVPEDWVSLVRHAPDEDRVLEIASHLPQEVAERLVALASGEFVPPPAAIKPTQPLIDSPDVSSRFYVPSDQAELAAVLNAPLEKWITFLHPSQRAIVAITPKGPVKVTGSAGTGKTVVAMHRARHLARQGKRVLLTSFVTTLCRSIESSLKLFCTPEELSRITVGTVHSQALRLVRSVDAGVGPAAPERIEALLAEAIRSFPGKFPAEFLHAEWESVVLRQGLRTWEAYRDARRTGRGTPLTVVDRKAIWPVFERCLQDLDSERALPWSMLCRRAEDLLTAGRVSSDFDAVLVDEVQDLSLADLRFLRELVRASPAGLMLFGDTGQRIYPGGFSLLALGIDTRGRSHVLRINYRTTEQIRRAADRILGDSCDDMEEGVTSRGGTRSLLSGPAPVFAGKASRPEENEAIVVQVREWLGTGLADREIAIFARTNARCQEIAAALESADIAVHLLAREAGGDGVRIGTMHRAKGLEFKSVIVAGCSASELPNKQEMQKAVDPSDQKDAMERERRLLYVAMTRARDELVVTWAGERSGLLGV